MQKVVSFNLSPLVESRLRFFMRDKKADKKPEERLQEVYDQVVVLGMLAYNKGDRVKV